MALKFDTVFGDFAVFSERKDLEATTVCEDWAIPVHELMEATRFSNDIRSWSNREVICIT